MRRNKVILSILVAAIVAAAVVKTWKIGSLIFFALADENPCGLQIIQEFPAPNSDFEAVLYQFDCGATTPFTTNISIISTKAAQPNESGNAFSAYGGSVRGAWGGPDAQVRWLNEKTLQISYVEDARVNTKSSVVKDTSIQYIESSARK